MGSNLVVVLTPLMNFVPGLVQRPKPVLVEALVPEFAVQALDEGVLCGLSGLDEAEIDVVLLGPKEHGLTGEFAPVVADNQRGKGAAAAKLIEKTGHAAARYGNGSELADNFSGVIIHDVQNAKSTAIAELVRNKVHRPSQIGPCRHVHRKSRSLEFLALLGPHLRPLVGVNPIGPLPVNDQTLGLEQAVKPQIPVSGCSAASTFMRCRRASSSWGLAR